MTGDWRDSNCFQTHNWLAILNSFNINQTRQGQFWVYICLCFKGECYWDVTNAGKTEKCTGFSTACQPQFVLEKAPPKTLVLCFIFLLGLLGDKVRFVGSQLLNTDFLFHSPCEWDLNKFSGSYTLLLLCATIPLVDWLTTTTTFYF